MEGGRVFQGNFKWVSRVFERSPKGIPGKFKRFKGVSRKFQGRLKGFSMEF